MDDIGKILGNILSSMPESNGGAQSQNAAPAGDTQRGAPSSAPQGGGADIFGLLNSLSPGASRSSPRMALLSALKPYLKPARRSTVDHAQNVISTAYSVRAALGMLDSMKGARDV